MGAANKQFYVPPQTLDWDLSARQHQDHHQLHLCDINLTTIIVLTIKLN